MDCARVDNLLIRLKNHRGYIKGQTTSFFKYALKECSEFFNTEIVGIWMLNKNHDELTCSLGYNRSKDKFEKGFVLKMEDYPIYFKKMLKEQNIVVVDTLNDPCTQELVDVYLIPNKVLAMMDIAICEGGKIIGIICFENVGSKRKWQNHEILGAKLISDQLALCLASAKQSQLEERLNACDKELRNLKITLSRVLANIDSDKKAIAQNISYYVESNIFPVLNKMSQIRDYDDSNIELLRKYMESLQVPLPISKKIGFKFSPMELKVLELVKIGTVAKEIATLLKISVATVETHKKNIRKKLGIRNKKTNLRNYLESLALSGK